MLFRAVRLRRRSRVAAAWVWLSLVALAPESAFTAGTGAGTGADAKAASAGTTAPGTPKPVKTGTWEHAISAYVPPKYPPGFTHFDHVNPHAPKGGTLRLGNPDRRSSFDKFNPYTIKGVAPAGLVIFMFESLGTLSMDEPMAMYGLLAESMMVEPDLSAISYRLRKEARFNNGDALTPRDVIHSHGQITSAQASPTFRTAYAPIARVVEVDARTVRFELKERTLDAVFATGIMPVFSHKWGAGKRFDEIVDDIPISTGAYLIDRVEMPRRIDFKRDPNYWGQAFGVRRGFFNFDRVSYRMFKDTSVRLEGFKAGEFDLFKEYSARNYARQHQGAKWRDGRIIRRRFETQTGQGLQALNFNLRREKFQDIRVREAIGLAYDFETYDRYKSWTRANSVFTNSDFAAQGLPSPGELALLEPFRAELPERVFGPAYVAPRTDSAPNALRENLRRARDLLAQAGWNVAADGKLRNAKGEAFDFEYLEPNRIGRRQEFVRNLERLGITMTERLVDFALYRRRLETFDYEMITIVEGDFTIPNAADLEGLYGSKSADDPGSNAYRGVKSRAVDRMLQSMTQAVSYEALRDAARALDRVVMWNFWQVPELYQPFEPSSYWNKFGIPEVLPRYYTFDTMSSLDDRPWPLWTWWDKSLQPRPAQTAGAAATAKP